MPFTGSAFAENSLETAWVEPEIDARKIVLCIEDNRPHKILGVIPGLMLSADATPRQIERRLQAGAKDYLTKPLDVSMKTSVMPPLQPDERNLCRKVSN